MYYTLANMYFFIRNAITRFEIIDANKLKTKLNSDHYYFTFIRNTCSKRSEPVIFTFDFFFNYRPIRIAA